MRTTVYLLIALAALTSIGCGNKKIAVSSAVPVPGVFRYPIVTSPTSLDPGVVQDGDTLDLIQQIYEGLVVWSPQNTVVGALAESWDIVDGGTTYVFHLKKGVKFHSGRECKAADVKWSIERNCIHKIESETVDAYLSDIVGLSDVVSRQNAKKSTDPAEFMDVPGIKVIDEYTLSITLKKPTPYFLGKLTYLVSAPMDKDFAPIDREMSSDLKEMVGTGPYRIVQYERDQIVAVEAFKDYHGGSVRINRVERPIVDDPMTRLNKFKNGELDLVMLERQDIKGIKADPELQKMLVMYQRPAIWYVGLNQEMLPQFKDKRVRQAFAMAIDKNRIVGEVLGGHNTVANGIVPPGIPGSRIDAPAHPFDPEKAKSLLADAGYPGGKGFPELTFTFREDRPDIQLTAEAVANDINKYLGIKVTLKTMEWRAYLHDYNRHQQLFFHMRWAADYLDPQNFLSHMLASDGPENKLGYHNPEFDKLCWEADKLMDFDKRLPLYQKAEDIALDDAVWIPIYFQRDAELVRPWVSGMRESLFGHLPHTTVAIGK